VLRLPKVEVATPTSVDEALGLLAELGERALVVAGGTDLVPNLKHGLFEAEVLVSLGAVEGLAGIREEEGALVLGATTTLATLAEDERVRRRAPALAQAASLVAGPQLRAMGTLGGNVLLDTRCQWYNQTYFWRKALGFCLKKDGTLCHVVEGGRRCVAAASNDTAPALMTLGATLVIAGPRGRRTVPIDSFWLADGIRNRALEPGELLVEVRVPRQAEGHRGAYGKLRERGSIDFPLFGCAVRLDLDGAGRVADADLCSVALAARPVRVRGVAAELAGVQPGEAAFDEAVERVAGLAERQCRPLENVPGEVEWRQAMVPVYARRTLQAAARGAGPVHHV
jgi:4-hydroxybenzoyl-CoA reductase subunit beta